MTKDDQDLKAQQDVCEDEAHDRLLLYKVSRESDESEQRLPVQRRGWLRCLSRCGRFRGR